LNDREIATPGSSPKSLATLFGGHQPTIEMSRDSTGDRRRRFDLFQASAGEKALDPQAETIEHIQ
jgi:hypothetical protein